MRWIFSAVPLLLFGYSAYFAAASVPCEQEDVEFSNAVNDFRESHGLGRIPISGYLTQVAQLHATHTKVARAIGCNLHSWGPDTETPARWQECCYTRNHSRTWCMHNKPREITSKKYWRNGYEISAAGHGTTAEVIEGWYNSPGHRVVMMSEGHWTAAQGALGCARFDRIYHCWFGERTYREGECAQAATKYPTTTPPPTNKPSPTVRPTSSPTRGPPTRWPTAVWTRFPTKFPTPYVNPTRYPTRTAPPMWKVPTRPRSSLPTTLSTPSPTQENSPSKIGYISAAVSGAVVLVGAAVFTVYRHRSAGGSNKRKQPQLTLDLPTIPMTKIHHIDHVQFDNNNNNNVGPLSPIDEYYWNQDVGGTRTCHTAEDTIHLDCSPRANV